MTHRSVASLSRIVLMTLLTLGAHVPCLAQDEFEWELRVMGLVSSLSEQTPALNSRINIGLPRADAQLHVRPYLFYRTGDFDFSAKPRVIVRRTLTENRQAFLLHNPQETDAFVNEWSMRYRLRENLYAETGREILVWGPSRLLSPSNPFRDRNGRSEPQFELPGLDISRLIWVASSAYTVSLIANTGMGRLTDVNAYRDSEALKIDWTGDRKQASLIFAHRDGGNPNLNQTDRTETSVGFFGLKHMNDAWIAYLEGSSDEDRLSVLFGSSYDFRGGGGTLVLEYFYDGRGLLHRGGTLTNPQQGKDEEFVLVQFQKGIKNTPLNFTVRVDQSIDGAGGRAQLFLNWADNDYLEFFVYGAHNYGGDQFGYAAVVEDSIVGGVKHTF